MLCTPKNAISFKPSHQMCFVAWFFIVKLNNTLRLFVITTTGCSAGGSRHNEVGIGAALFVPKITEHSFLS